MSIMCSVYVPEGIVLAADSRMTGNIMFKTNDGKTQQQGMFSISDNAQKVFLLSKVRVGISYCGLAILENKTVSDFLRIFEIEEHREQELVHGRIRIPQQVFFGYPQDHTADEELRAFHAGI